MQGGMRKGYDPGSAEFWDCLSFVVREAQAGSSSRHGNAEGFSPETLPMQGK